MTTVFIPMQKGTILIPTGPTEHLHFICCDPIFYPNLLKDCVLVVNISSIDEALEHDKACELNIGDHPFVKHPSYIYYRKAEILGAENISRNIAEGNFTIHQPCSDKLFHRILEGFGKSEETRYKIKRFYENNCT